MRSFDSLSKFVENGWSAAAQSQGDPIFTPIGFTGSISLGIGTAAISTASIASRSPPAVAIWSLPNDSSEHCS